MALILTTDTNPGEASWQETEDVFGLLSGSGNPDGIVEAPRGTLFVSDSGTLGNPAVYQNVSNPGPGTDWVLIAQSGAKGVSGIGGAVLFEAQFGPTGAAGATSVVTANGVVPTDRALVTIASDDTGSSLVGVLGAVCGTDDVTITFANAGVLTGDGLVNVVVIRPS
jgi:hypothetical protein